MFMPSIKYKLKKRCSKCREYKSEDEFYKSLYNCDKLQSWCKSCYKILHANYYKENKEKCDEMKKNWMKNNKEHLNQYKKNIKPWVKLFWSIRYRCNNPNATCYSKYGGKGVKCLITKEELKQLWFRDKAYNLTRPSIDRKNSKGNYILDNCQFIELSENSRKDNYKRKARLKRCLKKH